MIFAIVTVAVIVAAFGYAAYKHVSLKTEFTQFEAFVSAELAKLKPAAVAVETAVVAAIKKV